MAAQIFSRDTENAQSTRTLSKGLLLGCGNPLLDISANVPDDFMTKYGMKPNDAILATKMHLPIYRELVEHYNAEFLAGGSVINSLKVAQWMLQQPNVAVFFGCVGTDDYARISEEKARDAGVDVHFQVNDTESTGSCAVLITGTHRSLCANLAAANKFTIDHIRKPENRKLIENARYYYISGFFLTVSTPTILEIARYAFEQNRPFLFNLSAPFISEFFTEQLLSVLPYIDVLFGNETEAMAFANAQFWHTDDPKEIGKRILALPKQNTKRSRIVIITQGQHPVLLIQKDIIEEFPVDLLAPERIVDTNGAGDAFVGGFLSQFIQNQPLDVCIRAGNYAAQHIIQNSGCTFKGVPEFRV